MKILQSSTLRIFAIVFVAVCLIIGACSNPYAAPDPELLSQQRALRAQRLRNLTPGKDILPELRLIVDSMHAGPHNACYYSTINVLIDQLFTEELFVEADSLANYTVSLARKENDSIGAAIAHRIRGQMFYKLTLRKQALKDFLKADSLLPDSSTDLQTFATITSVNEWKWMAAKVNDNNMAMHDAAKKYADAVKRQMQTGWRDSTAHFPVTAMAFEASNLISEGLIDSATTLLSEARDMIKPELPARAYEHFYEVGAQLYASKGDYESAFAYTDTLISAHKGFPWFETFDHRYISKLAMKAKIPDKSIESLNRFAFISDSLFTSQINKISHELTILHRSKVEAEQRRLDRIRTICMSIALVFALCLLGISLYYAKKEREMNKLLVKRLKAVDKLKSSTPKPKIPIECLNDIDRLDQYMLTQRPYTDAALSRRELAQYMGMPQEKVAAIIREQRGQSVVAYINSFRLDEARHMLESPESYSISEIAESLGFGTPRTLQRAFKDKYNMSPSQYREFSNKA